MSRLVIVRNESAQVSPAQAWDIAWALGWQAEYHFNRSPWVEHGYVQAARVLPAGPHGRIPAGAWVLALRDAAAEQQGELGYHDETGAGVPFGVVLVGEAIAAGNAPSEVASHELLELLVDPDVQNIWTVPHDGGEYAVEVGDPVQGCGYGVGGVLVADFCWPAWFGLAQTRPNLSQRGSVSSPFELAPSGYASVKRDGVWSSVFGQARSERPPWSPDAP